MPTVHSALGQPGPPRACASVQECLLTPPRGAPDLFDAVSIVRVNSVGGPGSILWVRSMRTIRSQGGVGPCLSQ
jgi:hypothetical protein